MDIFHCQKIRGNVCRAIDEYFEYIGHVQIAQVPNRGEPGSHGELNYKYILKHLEQKGYDGWVGLEYNPVSSTLQGLQWLADFGYKLNSETEKEMVE